MKSVCLRYVLCDAVIGALLTGCMFNRVTDSPRHFVLTPIQANGPAPVAKQHLSIGIGFVRMPEQLLQHSIAVQNGSNELEYLDNALWAERLDHCFERMLAANLSQLLSSDDVYLDDVGRDQVMVRVSVNVQQFVVDTRGTGTLIAQWQITAPGKDLPMKPGLARLTRKGAPPNGKPEVIATTMSDLAGDFSRQLAQAISESAEKFARTN